MSYSEVVDLKNNGPADIHLSRYTSWMKFDDKELGILGDNFKVGLYVKHEDLIFDRDLGVRPDIYLIDEKFPV